MIIKGITIMGMGLLAAQVFAQETPALKTEPDRVGYAVGAEMGAYLRQRGVQVTPEAVIKGFQDALAGRKLVLSQDELNGVLTGLRSDVIRKQTMSRAIALRQNGRDGSQFLAQNQTKPGVQTLPSGLQYKIIQAGSGPKPTDADTVTCRYRGTHLDGTEFDRSPASGQPATFKMSEVIAGWREALKLMPVGAKWQLFIPSQLAYGQRGSGHKIEPNETLIFELELVGMQK